MKDFFTEQLVKHRMTSREIKLSAIYIGVDIAVIICIMLSLIAKSGKDANISFFVIGIFISAAIAYLGYLQVTGFNVEFEYIYTNGILDIDVIRNRSRRKNIFSSGVADFEIMAHISDKEHLSMYDGLKTIDLGSGETKDNTYVFIAMYKGSKRRFIIEPKEELLKAMLTDLTPRRLFIKKIRSLEWNHYLQSNLKKH